MGVDLLKPTLETDHSPKAEHIDPIKLCLIRDDLHMRVHLRSKGHLLTPPWKEIWRTRAERLQWHAKNRHENILFTYKKIYTIKEQYNNQNNKIYAQKSLEVHSEGGGRPSHFLRHGLVGGCPIREWHLHFCKKGVKLVPDCIKRMGYKELWNLLTQPSSMIRNGSSSKIQLLPRRPRRLRCGCGETFWPSSAPRIGPWGVQTSTPWTVNCGLFWRTWLAESITTTWRAWRDPS